MGPGDRVEDLELGEPLGVLLAEHALARLGDRPGAGGGVDTIGSAPSPLQPQSRSTISFALWRWASPKPFELQGSPQQLPATSSGIQTGRPARARPRPAPRPASRRRSGWCRRGRRRRRRPRWIVTGSFAEAGPRQRPAALGAARQRAAEAQARRAMAPSTAPQRFAAASGQRVRPARLWRSPAQFLDQLAGVDPDRAGELAGAVGGAGLERRRTRTPRAAPRAPASPRAGGRSPAAARSAGAASSSGCGSGRPARRSRTRRRSSPTPRSPASFSGCAGGRRGRG